MAADKDDLKAQTILSEHVASIVAQNEKWHIRLLCGEFVSASFVVLEAHRVLFNDEDATLTCMERLVCPKHYPFCPVEPLGAA